MKNLVIGAVIVAVLGLGAFIFVNASNNTDENQNQDNTSVSENNTGQNNNQSQMNQPQTEDPGDTSNVSNAVTITYTDSGFSPRETNLKVGGTITWVNNSTRQIQIGVDPHPVHTGDKAITDGNFTLDLDPGEEKVVTVEKTGEFGYHNHLDSLKTGTVIVE